MVDTVLFDIGNVFVRWDPRYLYEKLIDDPAVLDHILRNVITLEWHTHHDKGRSFSEGRDILTAKYPDYADLIAVYDERWAETIGPVITGTVRILEALVERGVASYALTNFSAEKWPAFARDYDFPRLFSGVVVSGEEGLVKPDPAIFDRTVQRFSLNPARTLFVDDREENVRAAEGIGMRGHVFTTAEGLRQDLQRLGLLP